MNNCLNCQIVTKNPKFCSKSCAATYLNKLFPKKKSTKTCSKCDKPRYKQAKYSSLCYEHHQEFLQQRRITIENRTLKEFFDKPYLENIHSSSKSAHIRSLARSWFKELKSLPCANCGYNKHVEVCHIQAITSFPETALLKEVNCKENLIQLCPNCHWEFDNNLLHLSKN